MKILLVGGGSGGHILPTLAVAAVLGQQSAKPELAYIGSLRPADREMVEASGLKFYSIRSGKLRRYLDIKNIVDGFNVLVGYFQARRIIARFKPDVVFSAGGYVSLPVVWAAGRAGVPVVAHESDIRVGLANRLGIKHITALATVFPVAEVVGQTPGAAAYRGKLVQTGLPIDESWDTATSSRPFSNKKPILMVTGGSQGASYINQVVAGAAEELLRFVNIVHYTGRGDYQSILSFYRSLGVDVEDSWEVRGFDIDDFRAFLKGADIVLARSGSSLMELAYLGKTVVVVPLPTSAGNHQLRNAKYFAANNAVEMIEQHDLNRDRLVAKVRELTDNKTKREMLAKNLHALGEVNKRAAEKIAELVLAQVRA